LELGIGSSSGKFKINDIQMIRFSSEKNFKKREPNFNLANENFRHENKKEEYLESDDKKELRIKNTRDMNRMLNYQKNKLKE